MFKSEKIASISFIFHFLGAILMFTSDAFSQNSKENRSQVLPDSIEFIFSGKFFDASNSNGFKIIKDSDLKMVEKLIFQTLRDQGEQLSLLTSKLQFKKDSIDTFKETYQSLLSENENLKKPKSEEYLLGFNKNTVIFPVTIFVLIAIIVYQLIFFIKSKKEYLETQENCLTLDKDFELYKRSAVERERKLVREIIDLKNKLSE